MRTALEKRPTHRLQARDITKVYGATRALKGVSLDIAAGQVTVLFGENGAGKSTLMKILSGVEQPTSGQLLLDGEEITFSSPSDAAAHGVAIIHQELNLAPNLSILDNIFMGREVRTGWGTVDYDTQRSRAREVLARMEEDLDPSTLVSELRIGQQQVVEIARALASDARVLIMDEPTSALSAAEVEALFAIIRELVAHDVAVVYISHHLEEALEISDHAVVFRDGEKVDEADVEDINLAWVTNAMVGRSEERTFVRTDRRRGNEVLRLESVSVADLSGSGRVAVRSIDLAVHAGEIVCLYGLMGAGRTELLESLSGKHATLDGRVLLNGTDVTRATVRRRIEAGLGLVPEDRQRDGIVQAMNVRENVSLASLGQRLRRGMIARNAERDSTARGMASVRLKSAGQDSGILSLSGGNQQKAVIAKLLATRPSVLLLDEPTRGIDVGAKGEIFALLCDLAEEGLAVLYATSEVGEALGASHRIVVMAKGRVVREFDPAHCTRDEVMAASGEPVAELTGAEQ